MKLLGINPSQKLILNFLYELRNTPMAPPDPRISFLGISKALGIGRDALSSDLDTLKSKGLVLPIRIGGKDFCKITPAGIREIEKSITTVVTGEISTSKVGIKGERRYNR